VTSNSKLGVTSTSRQSPSKLLPNSNFEIKNSEGPKNFAYSGDQNIRQDRFSNGQNVSECKMVQFKK
jgi:hypothetical protein